MKKILFLLSPLLLGLPGWATDNAWLLDYDVALAKAKEANRPILLEFTGSTWCPPCQRLKKETTSQPKFLQYAEENLVLVELDYLSSGEPTNKQFAEKNSNLLQEYAIEGFPTLVLLNADGEEIARNVGFLPGGPEALISWIEEKK